MFAIVANTPWQRDLIQMLAQSWDHFFLSNCYIKIVNVMICGTENWQIISTVVMVLHLALFTLEHKYVLWWFADCMSVVILQVLVVLNGQRHMMQRHKHLQWFQLLLMVVLFVLGKLLLTRWHTGKRFFLDICSEELDSACLLLLLMFCTYHNDNKCYSPLLDFIFLAFICLLCVWLNAHYFFSIHGENKHFDTPTNPAAPDRVPGGCSSGSAVAVAGGMVDFALGEPFFSLFVEFLDSLCVHCTFLSAALLLLAFLVYLNSTRITASE